MAALRIVEGSAGDVPALEPLWVGVHHVHQESMPELAPYVSDAETWAELRRHYESLFESLAVRESHRGQGIGSALLDRVDEAFDARGVRDVIVGALAGNEGAMRLYARRGFRPTWLYMSRFDGR